MRLIFSELINNFKMLINGSKKVMKLKIKYYTQNIIDDMWNL